MSDDDNSKEPTLTVDDDNRSNVILLPLFRYQQRIEEKKRIEEERTPLPEAPPPRHELESAIEAILLAIDRPVTEDELDEWLCHPGKPNIRACLRDIQDELRIERRGYVLKQVARGWQFRTSTHFKKWVSKAKGGKITKLSKAALEALAIVAYRQPVARSEIDHLRGVDSGAVVKVLIEHKLIAVVGRKQEAGNALIYGTTDAFLSLFNLRDLADLPTLRDLRELEQDEMGMGTSTQTPSRTE